MTSTVNRAEAKIIARSLLKEKLIVCASVINNVSSLFWWKQKVEETEECVLLMKSRRDLFNQIEERVRSLHSYKVPEIVLLPIINGSSDYLKWIDSSLK